MSQEQIKGNQIVVNKFVPNCMAKASKKTGKGRLDKYYKLAKEQGYRARSAFKLIQLNKKFAFLESARCCIDLCAAPGGWLQVASKYMPMNSVIVGVDLVPIRPIPRVVTLVADITTPRCRNLIRAEVKDWKADVVLHDGAPNVGTAWIQDAFSQSELVLMSLKLAVDFLIKGGTFVTKVFRSADYNSLLWVFNQLFGRVEATKPPSSRNVSAEIFVVCRDFHAPKYIDPKFLDPKHVFKDFHVSIPLNVDKGASASNVQTNVFHPEKKRRKRDGYDEGDYTLFKKMSAGDFVRGSDPVSALGNVNKISFVTEEEQEWLKLDITSADVKANCDDLKVLGKADFKTLLKWRLALREELGIDLRTRETEELTEVVKITEELDEEQQISQELKRLNAEAAARTKRERRRANEIKARTIQRMQLQMTAPLDIGLEQYDASLGTGQDDIFDLGAAERDLRNGNGVSALVGDNSDTSDTEDEDNGGTDDDDLSADDEVEGKVARLETELDRLYDAYQEKRRERDAKHKVKQARQKSSGERDEWHGINEAGGEDGNFAGWEEMQQVKEHTANESSSTDSDDDESVHPERKRKRDEDDSLSAAPNLKSVRLVAKFDNRGMSPISRLAQVWFSQDIFSGIEGLDDVDNNGVDQKNLGTHEKEPSGGRVEDEIEIVPQDMSDAGMWVPENENDQDKAVKKYGLVTPEAVTLAQQLINRQKTKTQLINDGFNRYSLNSTDGLPSWFLDDEAKHYKSSMPVSKEAIAMLRAKQRALDARPIKKIAEAKARKKFKARQKLEKAVKKAEGVNSTADMSEKEKAQQIEKLLRKGSSRVKTKKQMKVVVAKGPHKGIKGRPRGVKGRYVMVDSRMKKELRARKRTEQVRKKKKRA